MFYSASGRGDHARLEILASTLCTDTVEEAQSIDSYAPDIRAYIASIAPPVYPFSINQELASQGKQVFDNYCARCHGTYGNNGHYPNLVIPFKEIGTDPEYITAALGKQLKQFGSWLAQSFYGEHSHLEWVPGYLAPPLDGIWATAPYLHNGSIPTIEALLNSAARPQYWTRNFDNSKDYNEQTLGWNYTKLAYGKADTSDPEQRKRLYDTTLQGYSNSGHTFGDGLTTEERQQILEYLKTL